MLDSQSVTPRGHKTMARLRTASRSAFADLGWQGTRVKDIVERAGVSHGTFYTYYENRAAILVDLVTETMASFVALASQPWQGEEPGQVLERIIGGFLDTYAADADVMQAWMQASREEEAFGVLYLDLRQRFIDRITEQLQAVVEAGDRPDVGPPVATVASALAAMVEHFAYCRSVLGEKHRAEDAVDSLMLVWGGAINSLAGFTVIDTLTAGHSGPGRSGGQAEGRLREPGTVH